MGSIYAFLAGLASAFGFAYLYENNEDFRHSVDSMRDQLRRGSQEAADRARDVVETTSEKLHDVKQSSGRLNRKASEAADAARRAIFKGGAAGSQSSTQSAPKPGIDLNACSREDLVRAGLSDELADKVLENRPYRNKLDLVSRFVIPEESYDSIKHSIGVDDKSSDDPIKVAS